MKYKFLLPIIAGVLFSSFAACYELPYAPYEAIYDAIYETVYEGPDEEPEIVGAFPFSFSAEDLYGNEVTEADLGDKEVFFVYLWATWCFSCVQGMPGLAELSGEFGDRVGFITLLSDFDNAANAAVIKQDAGADFITVSANHDDFADLLPLLQSGFVPTSIILDLNGDVIGEQIVGGSTRSLRTAIRDALS
ncbi:MAG: TlpA family protein disulfide reductase [Defluviitaleaceae bacterium]|nr:TlpA family protein disulfide reductase [Defluviitaleaceae bacterium]